MNIEDFALLGRILKPQGNKGEVRVSLETDFFDELADIAQQNKKLYIHDTNTQTIREYTIEEFWIHNKGFCIVKFFDINSMEEAEVFSGFDLLIHDKDRWKLPKDYFYIDEIIGMKVIDAESKKEYGTVQSVITGGSTDLYLVRKDEDEFYLPAIREFIKNISLKKGIMKVQLPEGLTEINKDEKV